MLGQPMEMADVNLIELLRERISSPFTIFTSVLDILLVIFLIIKAYQYLRFTRALQLFKGIIFLIIVTFLSSLLKLTIVNYVLSSVMSYGIILLIIVFQPELRRGLEQLGTTNRFYKFFNVDETTKVKTKENIYKIAIAATELSKKRKGALMVIERDIKIQDVIATGIMIDSEISPQLLVNIFEPNTPLHDGAVIIKDNKIAAASCMLPLADDKDIARELGTRHRAAIGISKESDAIVVVVSEETGKISIAKDGTLIADVREDVLKKILIKNLINEPIRNPKLKRAEDVLKEKEEMEENEINKA